MNITGEYLIEADRESVWRALNDPAVLQTCIPGCESLEQVSDTELKAVVKAAVGPVRAKFNSKLLLENLVPPSSYTLTGESKAGAAGFGRGSADVVLAEVDGGTRLTYTANFKVGGKLAQVGSRLVAGATRKTADEFFNNFARELGPRLPDAGEPVPVPAASRSRSTTIVLVSAAVGALLLIAWYLLR